MHCELWIKSGELLADVRSAAWLEAELHPELDRHRRHEMADICETDNIERVWRVLAIAVAEIRAVLVRILRRERHIPVVNDIQRRQGWRFSFLFPLKEAVFSLLRENIHEYLVAAVMAERTAVIMTPSARVWRERADARLAALRSAAVTASHQSGPVRRPLWPL